MSSEYSYLQLWKEQFLKQRYISSEVIHSGHKKVVTVPGIQGGRSILHRATQEMVVGNNTVLIYSAKDIGDKLLDVYSWIFRHYPGFEELPVRFNYENKTRIVDLERLAEILPSANEITIFCAELLDRLAPLPGTKLIGVGSLAGGIIGRDSDLDILVTGQTIPWSVRDKFFAELDEYRKTLSHQFRDVHICYPSLW